MPMQQPSLDIKQVRMILRIYWTDRYMRQLQGKGGSKGLKKRIARQFNTTVEIVKKVVAIKTNTPGLRRRRRYPTIDLASIKRQIKRRLRREGTIL